MTDASLVFVATNERQLLLDALESLHAHPPKHAFEVVVVDNASEDGTRDAVLARWPDTTVLGQAEKVGLPRNLNTGIRGSTGRHVMLCNSDLLFPEGGVDRLVDFLDATPAAGMAAPRLLSPEGDTRFSARRWYTWPALVALKGPWADRFGQSRTVRRSVYAEWDMTAPKAVDWVPCPATLVRRAAFDEVGLMDERFRLYFDDVDISLRMHEGGWQVWCVPDAHVVHIEQRSSVTPFSRAWRWHLTSLARFVWKHKGLTPRRGAS
jgi:GT2 family glycosyltransferase